MFGFAPPFVATLSHGTYFALSEVIREVFSAIAAARTHRSPTVCSRTISVPHPFAFFLAKGWESTNPQSMLLTQSGSRKQKPQHSPHPRSPARLVMCAPMHLLKVQRLPRPPPIRLQPPGQKLHIPQRLVAFPVAHVQPNARPFPKLRRMLVHIAHNALVVPPHARR